MKYSLKSILQLLISLSIGVALLWYLQRDLSESDRNLIFQSFQNIDIPMTIIVIILTIIACVFRSLRWELLLEPLGYRPSRIVLLCSIFVMYLANLLFPRLGEVLRCTILKQHEDIPIEKSLGTMIVERIVDVIAMMGLIPLLGLIFEYDSLLSIYQYYKANKSESSSTMLWIILGVGILGGLLVVRNKKLKAFIVEKIQSLIEGVRSISKLKHPWLFILYSVGIYGIYFVSTILMYRAIEGLDTLSWSSGFVVLIAGTLGVGMTQGGIGAYQLLVTEALQWYHIPKPIGLAYSWICWGIQTITLVFFGFISWIYLNIKKSTHQ